MIITAEDISKRYSNHWIIKNFNFQFEIGNTYAIKGPNGSGKSTLLKILSGFLSPTVGRINYKNSDKVLSRDEVHHYIAFWGPYISLLQDLTIEEMIAYYLKHKGIEASYSKKEVIDRWDVNVKPNQYVKSLSSGQAQRLGVLLNLISGSPVVLLDEPTSFLDQKSKGWFFDLISNYKDDRIVIIASNDEDDFLNQSIPIQLGGEFTT